MFDDGDVDEWEKQRAWEEAKLALRLFGAAFRDSTIMADLVASGFSERDCTAPALAQLWSMAVPLYHQNGRVDPSLLEGSLVIVMPEARAHEVVKLCVDARVIHRREEVPTLLAHMRRRAGLRRMGELAARVGSAADRRGADLGELLHETRRAIDEIGSTAAVLSAASASELAAIAGGVLDGKRQHLEFIPLGLPDIDAALGGGAVIGRTTLILAGTGAGKTTYGTHMALTAARAGKPTLYLLPDAEADRDEMAVHFLEMIAGARVPRDISTATRELLSGLAGGNAVMSELPLWVEDCGGMTVEDIEGTVNAHLRAHDLVEVVVDYVQDIEPSTRHSRDDLNHKHISKRLRRIAKDRHVAVIELSQVSAPSTPAGPPRKGQGRALVAEDSSGSKQYAKDASAIVSVERKREEKDEKKRNVSSVRVLKNRFFGKAAECWMKWSSETTRLTPCTKDGEPVEQIEMDIPEEDEPFP